MDQSIISRVTAKIGVAILALALVDLIYINYWVLHQSSDIGGRISDDSRIKTQAFPLPSTVASPTSIPAGSPTVETKTVVEKESKTIVQTAQKEIFIPIGSGKTFSNSYVDLPGLQVSIDTTKYSPIESVIFEATIKVQDGNGKVYARFYQKDVGGVGGSEISSSSANGVLGSSSSFLLPSGNRVYTVQAKTDLVEYAASVENARVKITLK